MKLTAESTVINDDKLNTNIDNAQTTANSAKQIADDTAQYFWFTSSGSDTGAHISEKTQAEFIANPSGGNLLARSNGIAVRDGLDELATFGSAARVGKTTAKNLLLDTNGFAFYNASDLLAILNADVSGSRAGFSIKKGDKTSLGIYGSDIDPVFMFKMVDLIEGEIPQTITFSTNGIEASYLGLSIHKPTYNLGDGKIELRGSNLADFVTEQGTSGIWTYRRWESGVMECWGTYTASIAITTSAAAYGGYRSGAINLPAFPQAFTSAPSITATANSAQGFWVNNVVPTTTGGTFYLSAGASLAAASRSIAFHVIGS